MDGLLMSSITTISRPNMPPKKTPLINRNFCTLGYASFLEPLEITENEFDDYMQKKLKSILECVNAIAADAKMAADKICKIMVENNEITNKEIAKYVIKDLFRLIRDSKIDDPKTIAYGILLRSIIQKNDQCLKIFESVKDEYVWTQKDFDISEISVNPKDPEEQGHRLALFFSSFKGTDEKYYNVIIPFMNSILDQLEKLTKSEKQYSELELNVITGVGKAFYLYYGDFHPKRATPATPKEPVKLVERFIDVYQAFLKNQKDRGPKENGLLQNIVKAPKILKISEN